MDRILVVEDESIIAIALEEHLTELGYEVVGIASTGVEAIEKAMELQPDLIMMDIAMPGEKDGIDAAEEILSELDVPIIFLTAYGDDALIKRAKKVEPAGYILKPYKEKELRAAIEVALYKKDRKAVDTMAQKKKDKTILATLQEQKETIQEQKVKLRDFDILLKEYLGLVVLGILENTNEDEPVGEKDLIEKIQSEYRFSIDPVAILTSLEDLERKGIINGRKGYFPGNERFFYFENVNAIKEKSIYGAFLAKLGVRKRRMDELAESIGASRK